MKVNAYVGQPANEKYLNYCREIKIRKKNIDIIHNSINHNVIMIGRNSVLSNNFKLPDLKSSEKVNYVVTEQTNRQDLG